MHRVITAWIIVVFVSCSSAGAVDDTTVRLLDDDRWEEGVRRLDYQPAEEADDGLIHLMSNMNMQPYASGYGNYGSSSGGSGKPWTITFSQTVDYVTNLALPIALTPANGSVFEDDMQFQTALGGQYTKRLQNGDSIVGGYGYYQSLHPDVHQLDLIANSGLLRYNRQLNKRNVAQFDYNTAYYNLRGQPFVFQNRVGAALITTPNRCWVFKNGFDYAYANFYGQFSPFLDSNNYTVRTEALRYLDNRQGNYITGGFIYGISDAQLSGFSYNVASPFVSSRFFLDAARTTDLVTTATYGNYNFKGPDPIQGIDRRDNIWTLSARMSRYVTKHITLFGQFIWYNADSNIIRQDYISKTVSTGASIVW